MVTLAGVSVGFGLTEYSRVYWWQLNLPGFLISWDCWY
jgi:hypothetical protein